MAAGDAAALIDDFTLALSPMLLGSGIRLVEGVDAGRVALEPVRAEPTQRATHLTHALRERWLPPGERSGERLGVERPLSICRLSYESPRR